MKENDVLEIDLLSLLCALWKKAWAICLAAVLCAGLFYSYAAFGVTPTYEASALIYINSRSVVITDEKEEISKAELDTAKQLVNTYNVIMKARTTLNEVLDWTDLDYSHTQLKEMITASSVDDTEVFKITVTGTVPEDTMELANAIANILPKKIPSVVDGTSARIIDLAILPQEPVAPNVMHYALLGGLLGAVLVCGIVVVLELLDNKIKDPDHLQSQYDLPVLAVIPDLMKQEKDNTYQYYRHSERSTNRGN